MDAIDGCTGGSRRFLSTTERLFRKMNNNNLKGMSLRTTLRLTTGVPLFLGIVTVVAVSLHLMTSNATGWMAPVVTSLENESPYSALPNASREKV